MTRRLALTIDAEHHDYPSSDPAGNAKRIIDLLAGAGVRATFFVQGRWANSYPALAKRMVADGHLVGCHSHAHCIFPQMTDRGIVEDLTDARAVLSQLAGDTGRWFRLPGGQGQGDTRIAAAVNQAGYQHVHWTSICDDWRPGSTAASVEQTIVDHVRDYPEGGVPVVVVHSWPDPTPVALEAVIAKLAGAFDFVRLDELAADDIPR